jgi:hypothetical protein
MRLPPSMRSPARSSTASLGVPDAGNNDSLGVAVGYLVMRAGLIARWLRVTFEGSGGPRTALRVSGRARPASPIERRHG